MKKILFSLVALMCSMSMNAQIMKVMKDGVEVAKYKGAEYSVVFEEAPAVENPSSWTVGSAIALMDGTNHSKYNYVSGDGNTLSCFALADGQTAVSGANIYAVYPYALGSVSRKVTQTEAEAAAGSCSRDLDYWKEDYEHAPDFVKSDFFERYHVTDELDDAGVSEENKAIVYAYIKGENYTFPGVELAGNVIKNVVIPAEQTAIADAADPQASVRVAKADGENLVFADVCAYVKVTPQFDCCAIALTSKGTEQLAGRVTVDYNNGEPTTTVTADGTNTVYLVGTITAGNSYYIAVRPETLASGYTIEFLTADKGTYYAQSTDDKLEQECGSVNDLGEFTTSGTWTKAIPTSGNDGNGHSWILLTPTIKMASISTPQDRVSFDNVPSWGADWVLPSAADFEELYTNGCISCKNNGIVTWRGLGILKYKEGFSWDTYQVLWTSTPDPNDSNKQMCLWTINGTIYGFRKAEALPYCIFKYTK